MALYPARIIRRLAIKPIELEVAHQVRLRYKRRNRTAYEQRFARNLMCGIGHRSLLKGKKPHESMPQVDRLHNRKPSERRSSSAEY